MRILATTQIRELDAYTIRHEPIASIDLMERASRAFADWFTLHLETSKTVGIVCGTGNNGGDGLAIARLLDDWGYPVKVWIVRGAAAATDDFNINLQRLPDSVTVQEVRDSQGSLDLAGRDVIIDALFGSGLSRPPEGLYASAIDAINNADALRVAVDIPSGLHADQPSSGTIVRAHYTISFELPKLAFFMPQSHVYTGEWVVVSIGLHRKFIREAETPYRYTRLKDAYKALRVRGRHDHKGTYGHALLVAGSHGKMGAAVLAARAVLRAGAGLLTVHIPGCGYDIMQTAVPEAMASVDNDQKMFSHPGNTEPYTTIGLGPGLGQDSRTLAALAQTLEQFRKPVVVDADALNLLGSNRALLAQLPAGSILTPHPKEFERLTGAWKDDFERLEKQRALARSLRAIVVLKGAFTSVADENGNVYFNSTGNPGMATGGTGDVLTGMITGLLAQDYTPREAAVLGVFLHGLAGDLAVAELSPESLIASDLLNFLPQAFKKASRG